MASQSFKISVGTPIPTAPTRYRVHYRDKDRNLPCFHGKRLWEAAIDEFERLLQIGERDVYIHDTRTGEEFRP